MLTREYVEKIPEISTMQLSNSQKSFYWPYKKSCNCTLQAQNCMKKCSKW